MLFEKLLAWPVVLMCVCDACRLPDEVRKADRPSALMRRSREAPPEGRNKRERQLSSRSDEHK
jgi:hypothetical protein